MKKKWLYRLALSLCAAVFLFSAYRVGSYYFSARQEADLYDDLLQQVQDAEKEGQQNAGQQPDSDPDSDVPGNDEPDKDELPADPPPLYAESGKLYRYDALYNQNPDLVGWIYIPGTDRSYPVMQTPKDEEYYLRRNFYKKKSNAGTPFLDKDSDLEDPNSRIMVYGHNLKSGGMFYPLTKYTKQSYWKKHPTFTFDTLYESRTYRIVAVVQLDLAEIGHFGYYAYDHFSSAASYNGFIQQAKEVALYDTGVTPTYGQQMMILSTCSYHVSGDGGRLVIIAVQESADKA